MVNTEDSIGHLVNFGPLTDVDTETPGLLQPHGFMGLILTLVIQVSAFLGPRKCGNIFLSYYYLNSPNRFLQLFTP